MVQSNLGKGKWPDLEELSALCLQAVENEFIAKVAPEFEDFTFDSEYHRPMTNFMVEYMNEMRDGYEEEQAAIFEVSLFTDIRDTFLCRNTKHCLMASSASGQTQRASPTT